MTASPRPEGLPLRQAALIAGLAYLLNPVTYAEFVLWPKVLAKGNVEQTVTNISAHHDVFLGAFFSFFINFCGDLVIAWALYYFLAPVNKALSLLASLFQVVYATICLAGLFNLLPVYRALSDPAFSGSGIATLHQQMYLLVRWFRYDYSMALVLFGIHLVLVGALMIRGRYLPTWLGVVLVVDGAGWIVGMLQPYLYPSLNLALLQITELGELVFMLWLLIAGRRLNAEAAG